MSLDQIAAARKTRISEEDQEKMGWRFGEPYVRIVQIKGQWCIEHIATGLVYRERYDRKDRAENRLSFGVLCQYLTSFEEA